jgi:hypothetical protein
MNSMTDVLTAARAAALFVGDVSIADDPTVVEVDDAIRRSLRTHGGSRGCAADLAAAYGERPELAVPRMRWALGMVESRYARRATPPSTPAWRPSEAHGCHSLTGDLSPPERHSNSCRRGDCPGSPAARPTLASWSVAQLFGSAPHSLRSWAGASTCGGGGPRNGHAPPGPPRAGR